jgi:DNA-3-methyladenine glycosylase II
MDPEILKKGLRHLKKDPKLAALMAKHPKPELGREGTAFTALCRAIVYQQLSGKAAATIYGRFETLFPKKIPTPKLLLKKQREQLRAAGLSNQKTDYLYDLARKFDEGFITPEKFPEMSDEEIREHLIAVKGIGVWTADMFLMFTLCRPNVLPTLDLGIKKGFKMHFNMRELPTEEKMQKLAKNWHPYCTLASWYLWRLADTVNPHRQKKK